MIYKFIIVVAIEVMLITLSIHGVAFAQCTTLVINGHFCQTCCYPDGQCQTICT